MSKYKSQSNRCFYCGIYYYLKPSLWFQKKSLENSETKYADVY